MTSGSARWAAGAAAWLLACGCTSLAGLDRPYHLEAGGDGGGGGGGGGGAGGEDCADAASAGCVYDRCGAVPASAPSGVYTLDPDGPGAQEPIEVYCGEPLDNDRWALVYN